MVMTIACVLRTGGDYEAEHADVLASGLREHIRYRDHPWKFVCISDHPIQKSIELKYDWPGWWAKMELFDTSRLKGPVLFFDLDTVFVGDLADIIAACEGDDPIILEDFWRPGGLQSSMMYLPEVFRAEVWAEWIKDPAGPIMRMHGDQNFLESRWLDRFRLWQEIAPDQIVSYKAHCLKGVPDGARVVIFHGRPRPWETDLWR